MRDQTGLQVSWPWIPTWDFFVYLKLQLLWHFVDLPLEALLNFRLIYCSFGRVRGEDEGCFSPQFKSVDICICLYSFWNRCISSLRCGFSYFYFLPKYHSQELRIVHFLCAFKQALQVTRCISWQKYKGVLLHVSFTTPFTDILLNLYPCRYFFVFLCQCRLFPLQAELLNVWKMSLNTLLVRSPLGWDIQSRKVNPRSRGKQI